jgi:hypothetical protein
MTRKTYKPMTRKQWEKMPAAFQYFHPWTRASQPLTMDTETRQAIEPQPSQQDKRKDSNR